MANLTRIPANNLLSGPLVATLLLLGVVLAGVFHFGGSAPWAGAYDLALSGAILVAAVATMVNALWPTVGGRLVTSIGLFLIAAGLLVCGFMDRWVLSFDPFTDWRHLAFMATVTTLTAAGLTLRLVWSRWLGLALGIGGAVSAGLNAAWALPTNGAFTWLHLCGFFGGALIVANLSAPALRESFYDRSEHAEIWRSPDPLIKILRRALLANLVAIPMLLIYTWVQPVVPATANTALGLALLLIIGSALVMARKVAGALLLSLGGLGLLAQTCITAWLAHQAGPEALFIGAYYVVFWLPAAALSTACGVAWARPTIRAVLAR